MGEKKERNREEIPYSARGVNVSQLLGRGVKGRKLTLVSSDGFLDSLIA